MILSLVVALAGSAPSRLPACRPDQVALGFDAEGGAFDGMSHGGTLLVVRNLGPAACTLPGLPTLVFKDAAGQPLPIARHVPLGMHPGPVIRPVGLAAGAEATAALRWVSGPAFDRSRCFEVKSVVATIGGATIGSEMPAHICGQAGVTATIEQPALKTDPTL